MRKIKLFSAVIAAAVALGGTVVHAKDWTKVKIGVEGAFPPWNMISPDGKLSGYDIDLTEDLCRRARVQCELIAGEWSSLIPSLNAGKFDLVLTLGINETRKKVVDFTIPYASGVATFLTLKGSPIATMPMTGERLNLNDKNAADPVMTRIREILKGKTVGVVQSTSQEQLIRAYFGNDVDVRTYKTSAERDLDITAGRIDAGFDSGVYATTALGKSENQDLVMTGPFMRGAMLATDVALGMRKGETELKAKFDEAIRAAAEDGTIRKLSVKWSKLDLTPSLSPAAASSQ
ncbi:transporter substrate-binding domain-containing protein [Microvirga puerhi]|uniref:Transporter substrate-binding domain-containing protein n=1 Tax=Microvirga puerhi TaxID=2876078 RepID=A0ABS7VSK5_9HYPH|nr:transporter substrate-binding domain-containing protein [Microvirga puerhi]MBZ6078060.1 transporter substrate-binding domain-containing protein [Microvirga puerhi]